MKRRLNYLWRLAGTGLSFTLFGLGGITIAAVLQLLFLLRIVPVAKQATCGRRAISAAFRLYIWFMDTIGLLSYEVRGRERLEKPGQLVIANHPSLLDVVFTISLIPEANCLVKSALWNNLFTRPPIMTCNYISNESPTLVEEGVAALARGETLVVFPEGTRTVPGEPMKLFRGFANIAILSGVDLTPVLISCTPKTLLKRQPWYHIPPVPPHFTIEVLAPIAVGPFRDGEESQGKNARALSAHVMAFYAEKLK